MVSRIAVGLESTIDILITFSTIEKLKDFSKDYTGDLSHYVRTGYNKILSGAGGEVPIDGKKKEAEQMLKKAKELGAEIKYSFGGNAAQQAATLERLDCETIFLGGLFPRSFSKLGSRQFLKRTHKELSQKFKIYSPASYILQVIDENRYILTEGEGRRIDQLRPYLEKLPERVRKAKDKFGSLDAISLVGWQVIFGNRLKKEDLETAAKSIKRIHNDNDVLLFTDTGGVSGLDETERNRLCKIYSLFDILSVNEDEILEVDRSLGYSSNDKFQAMKQIMKKTDNVSTVWLHTKDFQATISSFFQTETLKKAQELSALAGLYKVETGDFPTLAKMKNLREKRNLSRKGSKINKEVKAKYGNKIDGYEFVITPAYKSEEFFSTVGAGDVSGATYLFSLVDQMAK